MSRFLVFTLLASAFVLFATTGTITASPQTADSNILIKCSTCGVEFTSKSATDEHVMSHPGHDLTMPTHPLIKCSTCGVEFTSQTDLKKHMHAHQDHKGAPLVKCSTCGVEFTSPELWKKHLEKHPGHDNM